MQFNTRATLRDLRCRRRRLMPLSGSAATRRPVRARGRRGGAPPRRRHPPSGHVGPAAHADQLSLDVAGEIGGQEQRQVRDVLGAAEARDRQTAHVAERACAATLVVFGRGAPAIVQCLAFYNPYPLWPAGEVPRSLPLNHFRDAQVVVDTADSQVRTDTLASRMPPIVHA